MHGSNLGTGFMNKDWCEEKKEWFEVFFEKEVPPYYIDNKLIEYETMCVATFDTFEEAWSFRLNEIMDCKIDDDKIHIDRWAPDPERDNLPYPVEEYI